MSVRRGPALVALYALSLAAATCGGRSALKVPPPLPPEPECDVDEDCPGHDDLCAPVRCVDSESHADVLPELPPGVLVPPRVCFAIDPVACDDGDHCTIDRCDPETGDCVHEPVTPDLDGDGHHAPLPGTRAGEPGSCGTDCNDASPFAFPGNPEVCDGVDNDCNGVVDDGAEFVPLLDEPLRVSGDVAPSSPGGLAFDGERYLAIYTGTSAGFDMYASGIDPFGDKVAPFEQKVALQNADSAGGPLVWVGDRYGIAWQDRRHNDYEIYFTLLGPGGVRAIPDVRVSNAVGFSINPSLAWNGSHFFVVWQDDMLGNFIIMAQRIDVNGALVGEPVRLTPMNLADDAAPYAAAGKETLGVAFASGDVGAKQIRFRTFDYAALESRSSLVFLSPGGFAEAVAPVVVWNEDRYVIAWYERTGSQRAVMAAAVDEDGNVLTPATALTSPGAGSRSRYPALLPLGDRLLLVYSDDRDHNQGYEIYSRMIGRDLVPLSPERRVTSAPFDSIHSIPAFGPSGDVGILFRDERLNGADHVFFTRLGCVAGE